MRKKLKTVAALLLVALLFASAAADQEPAGQENITQESLPIGSGILGESGGETEKESPGTASIPAETEESADLLAVEDSSRPEENTEEAQSSVKEEEETPETAVEPEAELPAEEPVLVEGPEENPSAPASGTEEEEADLLKFKETPQQEEPAGTENPGDTPAPEEPILVEGPEETGEPFVVEYKTPTPVSVTFAVQKMIQNGLPEIDIDLPKGDIDVNVPELQLKSASRRTKSIVLPTFTFNLTGSDGAPMPESTTLKIQGVARRSFPPITFTEAGTYTYEIREVKGSETGYRYDTTVHTITVTVTETEGVLSAAWRDSVSGTDEITFTNVYQPLGAMYNVEAKKEFTGKAPDGSKFFFIIADEDGFIRRVSTNDADGTILFKGLFFTKAGTYTYTLYEEQDGRPHFTYDTKVYSLTFTVTDIGGQLYATCDKSANDLVFRNAYTPEPVSFVPARATKILTGATLKDGMFRFLLKDKKTGTVVSTGTNSADGTITFTPVTYTEAGTYTYTLSESTQGADQFNIDPSVYTVTVTVTDNDGVLTAASDGLDGSITFTNSAKPYAEYAVTALKKLSGKKLKAGMFTFRLTDAGGKLIDKAVNAGDGTVAFAKLRFDEPGTYTYYVTEVDSDTYGIVYDHTKRTVRIEVTEEDGVFSATSDAGAYGIVFKNYYDPEVPKTGDTSPENAVLLWIIAGAACGIAVLTVYGKKKSGSR